MTEAVATLKLEAVGRVAERLLREATEQPGCVVYVESLDVATELRGIVEAVVPTGQTATETAMAELALWSQRHAHAVDADALEGALFAELVSLQLEAGRRRGDFLARCARAYDSLKRVREELEALDALVTGLLERNGAVGASGDQG